MTAACWWALIAAALLATAGGVAEAVHRHHRDGHP